MKQPSVYLKMRVLGAIENNPSYYLPFKFYSGLLCLVCLLSRRLYQYRLIMPFAEWRGLTRKRLKNRVARIRETSRTRTSRRQGRRVEETRWVCWSGDQGSTPVISLWAAVWG